MAPLLNQLELFHGALDATLGRFYARLPLPAEPGRWELTGRIRGPESRRASMLPASLPLTDAGPGATLLSTAVVPDPCCWSPDSPVFYRAKIELRRDGEIIEQAERLAAFRQLGVRGKSLYLDGRRWVPRGVWQHEVMESPLDTWREHSAVMLCVNPSDALCQQSSETGVLLIAQISDSSPPLAEARRLARWPAVAILLFENLTGDESVQLRRTFPNVLLAQLVELGTSPAPWAQIMVIEAADPAALASFGRSHSLPVLAMRMLSGKATEISLARDACDHLQRDLAPHGDFAGYIV